MFFCRFMLLSKRVTESDASVSKRRFCHGLFGLLHDQGLAVGNDAGKGI